MEQGLQRNRYRFASSIFPTNCELFRYDVEYGLSWPTLTLQQYWEVSAQNNSKEVGESKYSQDTNQKNAHLEEIR